MDCTTNVCEEIMIEILSRLPAKPLIRSMAVCRLWKSIITSPLFRPLPKLPTKLLMLTDRECYTLLEDDHEENRLNIHETYFPLSKHSPYDSVQVIGSDNGLICIGMISSCCNRVIIWNPFIRKHVVIPDHHMDDVFTVTTEYASGFGGTISGGDYKYVRVVGYLDGGRRSKKAVDIYSLKAGTWRRKYPDRDIGLGMGEETKITFALLRGRLHWFGGHTNYYKESLLLLGDHRAVGKQPTQKGRSKYFGCCPARTRGACSYPSLLV